MNQKNIPLKEAYFSDINGVKECLYFEIEVPQSENYQCRLQYYKLPKDNCFRKLSFSEAISDSREVAFSKFEKFKSEHLKYLNGQLKYYTKQLQEYKG